MSRIGKKPITVPEKVDITLDGLSITVKGPKGELSRTLPEGVSLSHSDGLITVSADSDKRSAESDMVCLEHWSPT